MSHKQTLGKLLFHTSLVRLFHEDIDVSAEVLKVETLQLEFVFRVILLP